VSAVNPILVVTNNLPDFVQELRVERTKLTQRLLAIDDQLKTLRALAEVVGVDIDPQL